MRNGIMFACVGILLTQFVYSATEETQDCLNEIYLAAERNFWDLHDDYLECYAKKLSAPKKQFFDKAIHFFDVFVDKERELNEIEREFSISKLCHNDVFIATKMTVKRNDFLINRFFDCVKRMRAELKVISDSLDLLPETKQRNEFISHYKKGCSIYYLRLGSRIDVLNSMCGMNLLYRENTKSWNVQGANVVVSDLTLVNKLNEYRCRINRQVAHIGIY